MKTNEKATDSVSNNIHNFT